MTTSTNIVNTLGAGSGIDIKTLAANLVEAERAPKKQRIDEKITKSEARISGYGAMKYALSSLKTAFSKLNDASDFSSITAKSSQSNALGATTSAKAAAGIYSVQVDHLAKAQRSESPKFEARNTSLNDGKSFELNLTVGEKTKTITVSKDTPAGIASAINGAKTGVTAQLIDTGTGFQLVLTGQTGQANNFSVSYPSSVPTSNTPVVSSAPGEPLTVSADNDASSVTANYIDSITNEIVSIALEKNQDDLWTLPSNSSIPDDAELTLQGKRAFAAPVSFSINQSALNSQVSINGLIITRPTNQINDVIDGVTLDLYAPTTEEARLDLTRDTANIKQNIQELVTAYNEFQDSVKILSDRKSEVEQFGGALAGDSLLGSVQTQVRRLLTDNSSTPGAQIQAARHVGLSIDRLGVLKLDEAKLDSALQDNFDEVVTMFSAGTNDQSVYSDAPAGLAGRAVKALDEMMRSTGLINKQTDAAKKQIAGYQKQLLELQERMDKLLTRYTNQFSVMESIVGESSSMRASLKNSFSAMLSNNN